MAAELRRAGEQRVDEPYQGRGRDPLRERGATATLSVEVAAEADRSRLAQRHPEHSGHRHADGADRLLAMDMLVRVQMRGISAGQLAEALELACHLTCDRVAILEVDDDIGGAPVLFDRLPFAEVEVQPQAERGMLPRLRRGVRGVGVADHEARARDDPVDVRADDPGGDRRAAAEVVGVDDEAAVGRLRTLHRHASSSPSTRSESKTLSAISRAARR
jgi:hypothetical protein